jgi:hypothetical protein
MRGDCRRRYENFTEEKKFSQSQKKFARRGRFLRGDGLVGSRTGAILRRFGLSVSPRFLWECLTSQTVSWAPAPATSNPSCRFPAMGLPASFRSRLMGPSGLAGLSAVTIVDEAGSRGKVPASRRATSYAISSTQARSAPGHASNDPEPSSLPSL